MPNQFLFPLTNTDGKLRTCTGSGRPRPRQAEGEYLETHQCLHSLSKQNYNSSSVSFLLQSLLLTTDSYLKRFRNRDFTKGVCVIKITLPCKGFCIEIKRAIQDTQANLSTAARAEGRGHS